MVCKNENKGVVILFIILLLFAIGLLIYYYTKESNNGVKENFKPRQHCSNLNLGNGAASYKYVDY